MDFAVLGTLAIVAWLVYKIMDAAIKPAWLKARLDPFWLVYVAVVLGAPLGWATGANAFPIFTAWPVVGRILSASIVGFGPSFIYDLMDKEPLVPTPLRQ
jgi:hypothetical protein